MLGSYVLVSVPLIATAQERASQSYYSIEEKSVGQALAKFAIGTRISVTYSGLDLSGYLSPPIIGRLSPAEALDRILSNTPFTHEFIGSDTVRLVLKPEEQVTPPAPRREERPAPLPARTRQVLIEPIEDEERSFAEIVVTARKRPELLGDLPLSVSVIGAAQLERTGARDFSDIQPLAAGITSTNLGTSRNKIFVRGISDGAFADRTQSTVGVYLDETPIVFSDTNPDLRLVDIERIEIVRGPQGTLFGSGSIGGVYRTITKKPVLNEVEGSLGFTQSFTKDGGANYQADGVVNIPLWRDRAAVRASVYYEDTSGFIDNVTTGATDINDNEVYGGRLASRVLLTGDWALDASISKQTVELADAQYTVEGVGELSRDSALAEPYRDDFNHTAITLTGSSGAIDITSSTAVIIRDTENTQDATFALPAITDIIGSTGISRSDNEIWTVNHETRASYSSGVRISWLLGAFVSRREEDLDSEIIITGLGGPSPVFTSRDDTVNEYAIFGEASYAVTDKLKVSAGLRWSLADISVDIQSGGVSNTGPVTFFQSTTDNFFSPKFAVSYEFADDLFVFAQASNGERTGGVNVNSPLAAVVLPDDEDEDEGSETGELEGLDDETSITTFTPDRLWNTEVGIRSNWLGGLFSVNASVFHVNWSDVQTDQILPTGFSFIANAGDARNFGIEAELIVRPTDNLEISGNLFWNDPDLSSANPFLGAEAGDSLPNISSFSAATSTSWSFPILKEWNGVLTGDYAFVGRSLLTFGAAGSPEMGDYHVGNLRLTAQNDRIRLGLFADNVLNEDANTFAFGNPFSLAAAGQATPLRPRTLGFFLEYAF